MKHLLPIENLCRGLEPKVETLKKSESSRTQPPSFFRNKLSTCMTWLKDGYKKTKNWMITLNVVLAFNMIKEFGILFFFFYFFFFQYPITVRSNETNFSPVIKKLNKTTHREYSSLSNKHAAHFISFFEYSRQDS